MNKNKRSARFIKKTLTIGACVAFACLSLTGALGLAAESLDRLDDSSPEFAWAQLKRELAGDRSALEKETLAYLDQVADGLDTPALKLVRVGTGDELSNSNVSARFSPSNLRIVLSSTLQNHPAPYRKQVILHEIGHALALFNGVRPHWSGARSAQTNQVLSQSLLGAQNFHESFADAFSIAWALRLSPADSGAWSQVAKAMAAPELHASSAHTTFIAIRLLKPRLPALTRSDASAFVSGLQEVAGEGAAVTIAHLEAEREAVCFMGARGVAKFARDSGYETAPLPWEMATTFPIASSEPYGEALRELASLRKRSPSANPWRSAIARSQEAVSAGLRAAEQEGVSPQVAGKIAQRRFLAAHRDALTTESFASAYAAQALAQTRSAWREALYTRVFSAVDRALPAPAASCPKL